MMNYIYDVLLNLNSNYYEFFFWEEEDNLTHVSKIPIIKVDNLTMLNILKFNIQVESNFLNKIKEKTVFYNKNINIKYLVIFTDNISTVTIMFNKEGKSIKRSSLLFDEEEDVLNIVNKSNIYNLEYKKLNYINKDELLTRKQLKNKVKLLNNLNIIYKANKPLLQYIYYECYNQKEENIDFIYKKLYLIVNSYEEDKINILDELILTNNYGSK